MAGTKLGGQRAAETIKKKYGKGFYREIGKKSLASWERNGRKPKGFAANKELARRAGAIGGKVSRRKKS